MWDLLDVSIPAVVLIPLIAIGVVIWVCIQQNAKSSHDRRAEFQRLQRLAMEEHERAERERERDYMRHKQVDPLGMDHRGADLRGGNHRGGVEPHGADVRRRVQPGNGYGVDVGLGEWRDPEVDARRRKQAEEEEQRRKQNEIEFNRRKAAEAEEIRKQQEEIADRKRRENLEEEMRRRQAIERRQAEEQEWLRRRADLEAQARREAEEELRRQAAEQGEKPRGWKQEESHRHEAANMSPRKVVLSSLNCAVCHKPTKVKRRCSRCKSMNYCSRECQVQHWNDGHKYECRPHDNTGASPRGSVDGDNRNYADFNSPRS